MIEESDASDDFTFPTVADSNSLYNLHFPGFSPSLWCVSSRVSDGSFHGDKKELQGEAEIILNQKAHQRRSLSSVEDRKRIDNLTRDLESPQESHVNCNGIDDGRFVGDEEKMDMLWENFNDELHHPSLDKEGTERPKGAFSHAAIGYESDTEAAEVAELCCVQALKMSKSSSMLPHRRPGFLVILKALKKLFLIHHSHCPQKTSRTIH